MTPSTPSSAAGELEKILSKHPKLIVGLYRGKPILTTETKELITSIQALIEQECLRARLNGYKEALYDSGYGHSNFGKVNSVETKLAKLEHQLSQLGEG